MRANELIKLFFSKVSSVGIILIFSPFPLSIMYKELLVSAAKSLSPEILRFDRNGILKSWAHISFWLTKSRAYKYPKLSLI